jgi:hypothetical protein
MPAGRMDTGTMSDRELIDWLCKHPIVSRHDEGGGVILTTSSAIGRGRDYRAALTALVADTRARRGGIPCGRERAAMAITSNREEMR